MSEQESLQKQLDKARRALDVLEVQAAGYTSLTIPVHLKLELEDKRQEVKELVARLELIRNTLPELSPEQKLQVFLCHSSGDKEQVRALYQRLIAESWIHPWLDEEELIPGQEWREEIEKAVEQSHVILVCLSPASLTKEGFVQREIRVALDHADYMPEGTIYIIPLKLEACEVPRRMNKWQWANYFEERGYEKLMRSLRTRAEKLGIQVMAVPNVIPPVVPAPVTVTATIRKKTRRRTRVKGRKINPKPTTNSVMPPAPKPEPQHAPEVIKQKDPQSAQPPVLPVVNYNAGIFPTPDPVPSAKPTPKPKSKPETEQEKLLRELDDPRTSHRRRLEIGDRLDEIGDTRPGVGLRADGLPDIAWLPVAPGGHITVEDETFIVPPFYMAKYLITYAQYEAFVKDPQGYQNPEWWKGMPIGYHPQRLDEQVTKFKNSPRDTISWYQSVAFTRWLNQRLKGWQFPTPGTQLGQAWIIGQNAQVRLPTEWEWQWAAQGGSQQKAYPWGNWQEGYANTYEAGLNRAVAVGMYPHGAATCGAMDLSGNLWEWCENKYSKHTERRVLRGGSFYGNLALASCVYRDDYDPFRDDTALGVRVVLVYALSRPSDL